MSEIIFLVEDAVEGGYTARALGESIFTEGDDMNELRSNIRDAVDCHFETASNPKSDSSSTATPLNLEVFHQKLI